MISLSASEVWPAVCNLQDVDAIAMQQIHPMTPSTAGRVLIADDQKHVLDAIEILLKGSGLATELVTHPACVLPALENGQFDAVLIDLNYGCDRSTGTEGLELVSQIRSKDSLVPVVVMTAWSSVDLAVEAMRRGASDFIQKPWDNQELLRKLHSQVSWAREQRWRQRQRDEELREAREIQARLLPKKLPAVAGYEIAAMTQPLRIVGGDFYTVVRISERQTAFCIADVAGKGLPAALLMSNLQAALTPLICETLPPRELCQRLNRILCDLTPLGKFVTFFYAVLDSAHNHLTYCNAGHNPPLLIRPDGTCAELEMGGAVLGQFPRWSYEQEELQMRCGDKLLLFTDGLVEVTDAQEEPFGEHNLLRITRENSSASAQELMGLLLAGAAQHGEETFQDDASLMVLKAAEATASPVDGGQA
jgi:sigma-B regulation protein RsbU (phosphoserine phosphatase)